MAFKIDHKMTKFGTRQYGAAHMGALEYAIAQGMLPARFETKEHAEALIPDLLQLVDARYAQKIMAASGSDDVAPARLRIACPDMFVVVEAAPLADASGDTA